MKYISLTNFDADGAVSAIMLDRHYNFEKVFACGYGKLDSNIRKAIQYAKDKDIKGICVTDWSLTLKQYMLIESNFDDVVMIDHHETSQPVYDHIGQTLDIKLCAAAQCARHIVKLGHELTAMDKKLLSATNAYDNWKTEHKDFMLGRQLTELFFHINLWEFIERFPDGFDGFDIMEEHFLENAFQEKQDTLDRSVVEDVGGGVVAIVLADNNIINDTTLMLPQYQSYFIFYRDWNKGNVIVSVRTKRDDVNVGGRLQAFEARYRDEVDNSGGHAKAGAIHFVTDDMDHAIDLIEYMMEGFFDPEVMDE